MSESSVVEVMERVYQSLRDDNEGIDLCIMDLKSAMIREGLKEVQVEAEKLVQNNRQGRKTMQAYFKKRGVKIVF